MAEHSWLQETAGKATWRFVGRVIIKAMLLFALCNIVFAALLPLEALGTLSLYNGPLPGRKRLPYGAAADRPYNLSLYNVPAMFASHVVAQEKAPAEFRVLLIGDSATWGWFLRNSETLAGQINERAYQTAGGRRVVAYNLGYPVMSLAKDLMLLDAAMGYQPDLVVWLVTLQAFPRQEQLAHPLLRHNPARVRPLIAAYGLDLQTDDPCFVAPDFWDRTIVGERRTLTDLLRLQFYGFSWAATGIDQHVPAEIQRRQSDFDEDISWREYQAPVALTADNLALDVLAAGVARAGDVPVVIVNEPVFISDGRHSDLRYNSFYPRWAYDAYRELLTETAVAEEWRYLDLWDAVPAAEFTNTPVHLSPAGSALLAEQVGKKIIEIANDGANSNRE